MFEFQDQPETLRKSFDELKSLLRVYDPVSLLSQLLATFMFHPEDEFQSESSESVRWHRYLEFLTALALSLPTQSYEPAPINGPVLDRTRELLDHYFTAVSQNLIFGAAQAGKISEQDMVRNQLKIQSLYVRGDEYAHQYRGFALSLYREHDEWFLRNQGFTIADAISLSMAIIREYEDRLNRSLEIARAAARAETDRLVAAKEIKETEKSDIECRIFCELHFGRSESLLAFTAEELARFSGLPLQTSVAFLKRMSQEFGYKSDAFPSSFTDPAVAPWDFNTLNERPIVTRGGRYWLFVTPTLYASLLSTFYFDIRKDLIYLPKFEKAKGRNLEKRAAEFVSRVFPAKLIFLNPKYPNGEEMADVLVLHDHKILVLQCKSKALTRPARIGEDFDALRVDVKKAIADAFEQGVKARKYLQENPKAEIVVQNGSIVVDMGQVNGLYILSVTASPLQNLAARLANTNSALGLFPAGEFPWSLSLGDLDILTQVLTSPAQFLHYLVRRIEVERTPFRVEADEMDFLGFYLSHGMNFETDDFKGYHDVLLSGFSDEVDRWVYDKFELGKDVDVPRPMMPTGFGEFLSAVEQTRDEFRTDCAVALLECGSVARTKLLEMIASTKEKSLRDGLLHSFSVVRRDGKKGISFVSFDANRDRNNLVMQAASFAILKKYQSRCGEWTGLGWDTASKRVIDVSIFLDQPWKQDTQIERLVQENLKPGQPTEV